MSYRVGFLMFLNYKDSSANKLVGFFLLLSLCEIILFSLSAGMISGQEKISFAEPFRKCRVFGSANGLSRIVASDNESNLIYTNDINTLISINPETNLENWKSQIVGKLENSAVADETSLYFVSVSESGNASNEIQNKKYFLNSLSLKTGLTIWQEKFGENIKMNETRDKDLIFIVKDDRYLLGIQKNDGKIRWTQNFSAKILSAGTDIEGQVNVLTNDTIYVLSKSSGTLINNIKLSKDSVNISIFKDRHVLLGYPTGEFVKVSAAGNRNEVRWKIKAGGSITDLIEINDEVLVTSMDNFIYLYSFESGKLKWKRRVGGRINISPLIYDNHAIVLNSAENSASVIELREGRVVNQIRIEEDNYFSGQPVISGNLFIFQTFRGIYVFSNSNSDCK